MKAGVTPKLSAKWWRDNRAKTLKSTGLAPALEKYERALADFTEATKKPQFPATESAFTKVIGILDRDVATTVEGGIKACGVLHKESKEALTKYKTQVIPQARRDIQATFKDAEKEYAVMVRDMVKAFKKAADDLKSALNIVNRSYVVLTGFETKLVNYLQGSLALEPDAAQMEAMKANQHANEVNSTVSTEVTKVLRETATAAGPFEEDMFVGEACVEFKKKLADFKDRTAALEEKWDVTEQLIKRICKDLFKGVMKRVTGMERAENAYLNKMDAILTQVRPKCDEMDALATDVSKRAMKGLKMEIELAKVVKQEEKIAKALEKLEEEGLQGEQLKEAQKPLLEFKKGLLEEKRKTATEIYKYYIESVRMATQGKQLALSISNKLDTRPEPPEDVDMFEKKFQQRQQLLGFFSGKVLKANPIFKKGQEDAEGRIRYFDEKVFKK